MKGQHYQTRPDLIVLDTKSIPGTAHFLGNEGDTVIHQSEARPLVFALDGLPYISVYWVEVLPITDIVVKE